jgi:hypothetical protein
MLHMCFRYSPDVPPDSQNLGAGRPALSGLRRLPVPCFSFPDDVPAGTGNRDAAEPSLRDPRRMPHTCFRY